MVKKQNIYTVKKTDIMTQ